MSCFSFYLGGVFKTYCILPSIFWWACSAVFVFPSFSFSNFLSHPWNFSFLGGFVKDQAEKASMPLRILHHLDSSLHITSRYFKILPDTSRVSTISGHGVIVSILFHKVSGWVIARSRRLTIYDLRAVRCCKGCTQMSRFLVCKWSYNLHLGHGQFTRQDSLTSFFVIHSKHFICVSYTYSTYSELDIDNEW